MPAQLLDSWLSPALRADRALRRGVRIGREFVSWSALLDDALPIAATLVPDRTYLIDPMQGFDSIRALLAVAMRPGISLVWGRPDLAQGAEMQRHGAALWTGLGLPADLHGGRSLYASFTSGTAGHAKLPYGYAEHLGLVGLHYDQAIYRHWLPDADDCGVIGTCLPADYSAPFMMCIPSALAAGRDLMFVQPHELHLAYALARTEPVALLTVPALLSAAVAAAPEPVDARNLTLLCTAGYLTRGRMDATRRQLLGVRFANSYGASETGVMTLDTDPDGAGHSGRPLALKSVWVPGASAHIPGQPIRTAGIDCREAYALGGTRLRGGDGAVTAADLGHFDAQGRLVLDGRVDSAVKHNGVLVYPKQVERHLLALPGVDDVQVKAVLGEGNRPDMLLARVVGNVAERALREHCEALDEACQPNRYEILAEAEAGYSSRGKL